MKKLLLLSILMLFMINCQASGSNPGSENEETGNKDETEQIEREIAPDFTLKDLEGVEHSLSDYRGNVVIIDFWATYCKPCREEIPYFIEFYNEYKDEGLVILGVGLNGEVSLKDFDNEFNINYPVLVGDKETAIDYGVQVVPTTFILDRNGSVRDTIIGYSPGHEDLIKESFIKLLELEEDE